MSRTSRTSRTSIPPEVGMALVAKAASTDGAAVGEWRTVLVGGEERLCQYGAEARDGEKIFFATVYDRTGHYAKATTSHGVDEAIDTAVRLAEYQDAMSRTSRLDHEPPQIPASVEITPEIDEEDVLTAVLLEGIWNADAAGLFAKRSSFPEAAKVIAGSVMAWIAKMDAADKAGETHLFQGIELLNGSGILTCLLCGEPPAHESHS